MDIREFDSSLLIVVALLVSLARLVRIVFATLRACVWEYLEFRAWLTSTRRQFADKDG